MTSTYLISNFEFHASLDEVDDVLNLQVERESLCVDVLYYPRPNAIGQPVKKHKKKSIKLLKTTKERKGKRKKERKREQE